MSGSLLLVGIGGYGGSYLEALKLAREAGRVRLVAVVDPMAAAAPAWPALAAEGIRAFDTIEAAVAAGCTADLAVISSPIAFHAHQTCAALAAGMHVLCEKPIAATVQEAARMAASRDAAGRFVAIGYQWSFSDAILSLKADLMAGRLGAPSRFRTRVAWPRDSRYYGRNRWAGRIRDDAGNWVLDSPVNNAVAHYLHNMLFLLGPAIDRSCEPLAVTAELYRANAIENYDTAALRIRTGIGVEVLFYAAHPVRKSEGPVFELTCEEARVQFDGQRLVAAWNDGRSRDYGSPEGRANQKLFTCLAAATGMPGVTIPCGIEAAAQHTAVVNGIQELGVRGFPEAAVQHVPGPDGSRLTVVEGLNEVIRKAYDARALFCECGAPWAVQAGTTDLRHYHAFPRSGPPA